MIFLLLGFFDMVSDYLGLLSHPMISLIGIWFNIFLLISFGGNFACDAKAFEWFSIQWMWVISLDPLILDVDWMISGMLKHYKYSFFVPFYMDPSCFLTFGYSGGIVILLIGFILTDLSSRLSSLNFPPYDFNHAEYVISGHAFSIWNCLDCMEDYWHDSIDRRRIKYWWYVNWMRDKPFSFLLIEKFGFSLFLFLPIYSYLPYPFLIHFIYGIRFQDGYTCSDSKNNFWHFIDYWLILLNCNSNGMVPWNDTVFSTVCDKLVLVPCVRYYIFMINCVSMLGTISSMSSSDSGRLGFGQSISLNWFTFNGLVFPILCVGKFYHLQLMVVLIYLSSSKDFSAIFSYYVDSNKSCRWGWYLNCVFFGSWMIWVGPPIYLLGSGAIARCLYHYYPGIGIWPLGGCALSLMLSFVFINLAYPLSLRILWQIWVWPFISSFGSYCVRSRIYVGPLVMWTFYLHDFGIYFTSADPCCYGSRIIIPWHLDRNGVFSFICIMVIMEYNLILCFLLGMVYPIIITEVLVDKSLWMESFSLLSPFQACFVCYLWPNELAISLLCFGLNHWVMCLGHVIFNDLICSFLIFSMVLCRCQLDWPLYCAELAALALGSRSFNDKSLSLLSFCAICYGHFGGAVFGIYFLFNTWPLLYDIPLSMHLCDPALFVLYGLWWGPSDFPHNSFLNSENEIILVLVVGQYSWTSWSLMISVTKVLLSLYPVHNGWVNILFGHIWHFWHFWLNSLYLKCRFSFSISILQVSSCLLEDILELICFCILILLCNFYYFFLYVTLRVVGIRMGWFLF